MRQPNDSTPDALGQENARLRKVLAEIRDDAGTYRHRTEHLHRIELLAKEALGEDEQRYMPADEHGDMIAALVYRGVMVCRSCVKPEEHTMTGQFYDWNGVKGSGWTCDRCGIELEHQERPK